jgi:NodT family efflux transporter outer membrane factor (OMF) lipoprotein
MRTLRWQAVLVAAATTASGCAVGPDYERPSAPVPAVYKEATTAGGATWLPALPADAFERGEWWRMFNDEELSRLMAQIETGNQTLAASLAAYRQARATVRETRAAYYPTVALSASARRSGGSNEKESTDGAITLDGNWAPDLWGRVARSVEGARASAEASAADLAGARLSAQGELATDYFSLRELDAETALLKSTIEGYERARQITQNRYAAGIAPKTDLLQAETQLATTRADLAAVRADRARFEHAIAVLVGKAPGDFGLAEAPWSQGVPTVALGVPSTLLQRRPDIASAERQVVAANAQIGIARSAWFPQFTLGLSLGNDASSVADLFSVSTALWSIGISVAQSVFDAGAIRARVTGAEAGRDAAIARYRQTVLVAFQSVEDQLASARGLAEQAELRRLASDSANQTEQQILNRYRAGQVGYTDVVSAQASALSARRALVQVAVNRQIAAIALIQALGGGWERIETP